MAVVLKVRKKSGSKSKESSESLLQKPESKQEMPEKTTDAVNIITIPNHIGTWKCMALIVSLSIAKRGASINKPAIIVYSTNKTPIIFHQRFFIS